MLNSLRKAVAAHGWTQVAPVILSWLLFAFQLALPWTAPFFVSQDGPSHLYTARVTSDLLFHSSPVYGSVYRIQPGLTSNWGTAALFEAAAFVFGVDYAEQVIFTLCVAVGFLAVAYLIHAIAPDRLRWTPVVNFLIHSWFLWIGFYNFYLGMSAGIALIAYAIRNRAALRFLPRAGLALALIALFFIHVLAAAIVLLSLGLLALWFHIPHGRSGWRPVAGMAAALLPAAVLLSFYLANAPQDDAGPREPAAALESFPKHAFASGRGPVTEETLLYPALLFFSLAALSGMRSGEWKSARGALATVAAICFLLYLFLPNQGMGGDEIKIRFAWVVFLFLCPVAVTVERTRPLLPVLTLYIAVLLAASLNQARARNVQPVSRAVAAYAATLDCIPAGSYFVRARHPLERTRLEFGFSTIALDPLLHVDSWSAARQQFINLSDYQALAGIFPIEYKVPLGERARFSLWELEGAVTAAAERSERSLSSLPFRIDYLAVLGDDNLRFAPSGMDLVRVSQGTPFVRLYKRPGAAGCSTGPPSASR